MTGFEFAVEHTLEREGVFSDDAGDPGGGTKFGITEAVAREWGYRGDIRDLSRAMAVEIYRWRYWTVNDLDLVGSRFIAAEVFDTGVNAGPHRAAVILQAAARVLSAEWTEPADRIDMDGWVGPMTLAAVNGLLPRYERHLYAWLNSLQGLVYLGGDADTVRGLVLEFEDEPWRFPFVRGWGRRLWQFVDMIP